MQRHQRRLADAEHVEGEQRRERGAARALPARMPPGVKSSRAGDMPGGDDRRQQNSTIDVPSSSSRGRRGRRGSPRRRRVRHQRIGDERQHLVEQEQREQVGGEGDADRAAERQREADVEARSGAASSLARM